MTDLLSNIPVFGDSTHKWQSVPGKDWQCCRICGIIRRADRQNSPCKGATHMRKTEPARSPRGSV